MRNVIKVGHRIGAIYGYRGERLPGWANRIRNQVCGAGSPGWWKKWPRRRCCHWLGSRWRKRCPQRQSRQWNTCVHLDTWPVARLPDPEAKSVHYSTHSPGPSSPRAFPSWRWRISAGSPCTNWRSAHAPAASLAPGRAPHMAPRVCRCSRVPGWRAEPQPQLQYLSRLCWSWGCCFVLIPMVKPLQAGGAVFRIAFLLSYLLFYVSLLFTAERHSLYSAISIFINDFWSQNLFLIDENSFDTPKTLITFAHLRLLFLGPWTINSHNTFLQYLIFWSSSGPNEDLIRLHPSI